MLKALAITPLILALAASGSRAWLTSSIREHQQSYEEARDINDEIKASLEATKALQAFNTTIYTMRTAGVTAMTAQAAMANCMVNFPQLYEQDDPSAAQSALGRAEALMDPLRGTYDKLRNGLEKIDAEAKPLAKYLKGEDIKARKRVGGKGTPSGHRADTLITDLTKATHSGLDANRLGATARQDSRQAAEAALNAANMETQAADKNDQISQQLNQICSQIKALPKDPPSLPSSIAQATSMAAQGQALHTTGMPPLTQANQAIQSAFQALKAARDSEKDFGDAIPGGARSRDPNLKYATRANDIRNKLDKKLKKARQIEAAQAAQETP